jgi:hypothetical protein
MEENIEKTKEEELKETKELLNNIQFFSDQVRFNSIVYQGLNVILERIKAIEEKLDAKK